MLTVADVFDDVSRVLGGADDAVVYSRLNDIVEILGAKADWDPQRGYVDVQVGPRGIVTLPREVGTVLSVNLDGQPTEGHNYWFKYHLNGPGDSCRNLPYGEGWHWYENLQAPVFTNPPAAGTQLISVLETPADNNVPVRVYGYDPNGDWIRSNENGVLVDGALVPTIFGYAVPSSGQPLFARITRVSKPITAGWIAIAGLATDNITPTWLGFYAPTDTNPLFRQIQVSRPCSFARIAFKKANLLLSDPSDQIFLHSRYAIVAMAKSLKKIDDDQIEEANIYEEKAVQLLREKQFSVEVPSGPSLQIADRNLIHDKSDRMN